MRTPVSIKREHTAFGIARIPICRHALSSISAAISRAQPGTALLLLLARGDTASGAAASIGGALAEALEQGKRSRAQGELQAARTTFESLGARLDLARLAQFDAALAEPS